MPFYQRLFDNVSSSVKNFYTDTDGVKIISISKPTNFEAEIDSRTYHRFAVAWGLSYPETDIGNVTRPEEINDVEKRERYKHPREFISKDMV